MVEVDLVQVGDGDADETNSNKVAVNLTQDNKEDTGDSMNENDVLVSLSSDEATDNGNYNNIAVDADQSVGGNINDVYVVVAQNQAEINT